MEKLNLGNIFFEQNDLDHIEKCLSNYFGQNIGNFIHQLSVVKLHKTEYLFHENDPADDMYVLISGKLHVIVSSSEKPIAHINIGECVGETALLQKGLRTASIRAARDSTLIKISENNFKNLYAQHPDVIIQLSNTIIDRLNKKNKNLHEKANFCKVIALMDIGGNLHADIKEYFIQYWSSKFRIGRFNSSYFENNSATKSELQLYHLEQKCDFIFMLSTQNEQWNNWIMNNCDHAYYVGKEDDTVRFELLNTSAATDNNFLVLTYNENESPTNVEQWLPHFGAEKIFKCQTTNQLHLDRIARIIAGKPICLILGGGGAKGFAHLGVLKALNEANIPIDIVGGTSFGAIIAGAVSQDWTYAEIEDKVRADISQSNPLSDYTFPFVSLVRGNKMEKLCKKHFNIKIENTWKNFFCVASNLSTQNIEVFLAGNMDTSIAASASIPGVLPPKLVHEELLVDGGIMHNVPVDIMRNYFQGYNITIDLNKAKIRKIKEIYHLNNQQYFKRLLGIDKKYVPSVISVIMQSITLGSNNKQQQMQELSDIYINPEIKHGLLDWKSMNQILKIGYDEMKHVLQNESLPELLELP
ncbi:MAG: patatin-like phospholipase family protein [Flavobacteriales bacterium]|nr:patatin-like phospholipase family protein [Flavobacteriales bacterium]